MKRWALLLLGCLLPSAMQAQLAGRWRLSLESSRPMLAELVLDSTGSSWRGSILLERPDSSIITLTRLLVDPGGTIRGEAPRARLELELKPTPEGLGGTLLINREQFAVVGIRLESGDEFYPSPPAFHLRQLVWGSSQSRLRIPGRWLAAIKSQGGTPEAARAEYVELALAAELTPLTPDSLGAIGLYRAMGLYRREEMVKAAVSVLERTRQGLVNDTLAARFDYLFRPAGTWLVDIHDVALARARRGFRTITWESARPALAAAGLLPDNPPPDLAAVPLALYRLFALRTADSVGYNAALQRMRTPDAASKNAVLALLDGYDSATQWYIAVLRFLLEQPVLDSGASIAERVSKFWKYPAVVPEIQSRSYGYPEGSARVGTDSALVRRLVQPLNATGEEWLARHRLADLLTAVHRLPAPPGNTYLELPGQRYRITSVGQAAASFNGFLEARDLVLLDPSYEPLLALGTLVHEWQHLLHEHLRDSAAVFPVAGGSVRLTQLNPYLAEGLAEWAAEQILLPLSSRYPLLRFGEMEKRLSLPEDDPHVLGYAMVRAVNGVLRDPHGTVSLLVKAGTDPALVLRDPGVASAWRNLNAPDRTIPRRGGFNLIPETRFRLIDDEPDVLETRIGVEGLTD